MNALVTIETLTPAIVFAANKKHRAKINSEVTVALSEVLTGDADEAARLIEAIAAGKIPHVSITY